MSNAPHAYRPGVVAENVKAHATRCGISQVDIAKALDIDQANVSRRMAGKTDFSAGELTILARLLGVSVAAFFNDTAALAEGGDAA